MTNILGRSAIAFNAERSYRLSHTVITMELRQLETFVAVAQERSFSRAAGRLHVVQSAVSATIRALEREWDVELFHRTTHRVELSDLGRVLLPEARAALRPPRRSPTRVDEARSGLRGTVRVGIMQGQLRGGGVSVAEKIAAFRAEHPGVTVEVRQAGSSEQVESVRRGDLDVAFVGLPDRRIPGLTVTPLASVEMQLHCRPEHPLATRSAVELAALAEEPVADLPPGWGVRLANDRAFAAAGVMRTIVYEINDTATLADFVRHGLAVAIIPPAMAADDLVAVPIRHHAPRFVTSLVAPVGRWISPAARAFTELAATPDRTR